MYFFKNNQLHGHHVIWYDFLGVLESQSFKSLIKNDSSSTLPPKFLFGNTLIGMSLTLSLTC